VEAVSGDILAGGGAARAQGHVKFVRTCEFWEPDVEEMVNKGVWRGPDWVKFYNVGSDRGYHYLGSARIYYKMGKAFAESMIELLEK